MASSTKPNTLVYITETRVRELLDWDQTFQAVKRAMESVSIKNRSFQPARGITRIPQTQNLLFSMPGFLSDPEFGSLGCKLVTYFPENTGNTPTIQANILLMDRETGDLKAVIAGTEITTWRTAAASAVATEALFRGKHEILAIIGAGTQARIHAIAFRHFFGFKLVRIWNRNREKSERLVEELNEGLKARAFIAVESSEECVRGADVVVTTTPGEEPVVKFEWLKNGAHINAVGVGINTQELDDETYKLSSVYVDCLQGARSELTRIQKLGVVFKGQIGDLIAGSLSSPSPESVTVFQSLGMAVEDCAVARLIYDRHLMADSARI